MAKETLDRPRWRDQSKSRRVMIGLASVVQFGLLAAALWDIRRRPAEQMRGSKAMWAGVVFINFAGPIAYFTFGRKRA